MEFELKNYEIKSVLGEGGMAVVYLAVQTTLQREVAIKVLRQELMYNEDIRRRFLDEGRKLASLNHEHIIKVYDLISVPGTVAMVMERVEGLTLKELLESYGKMEKKDALELLGQMTSALGYVHEQSYIHRDIKPSNFMVTNNGKVKLLDFGIAKDTGEESMIRTQTGTGAMGTPMYMSPEQIKEVSKVERQTDIYSLGVVLWQMLSGEKPYQGMTLSDFDLKYKIVHEPLKRLGSELDKVIGKATEKQVESRYRTCDEMWEAATGNKESQEVKWKESDNKDSIEKTRILFKVSLLIKGSLKYGFIDIKGNMVIQPIFDCLREFDDKGYCCAQLNGRFGFINRQDNWIIQPIFDYLGFSFDDKGYCCAQLNGRFGFINRQGKWVIQPVFDRLGRFDDKDYCVASLNDKYGYINRQGNWIIQPVIDSLGSFDNKDYCHAEVNGKYGFIERQGKWVIQPVFDRLGRFDDKDYCVASLNDKYGYINRQGNWIIQPVIDRLVSLGDFDDKDYCFTEVNGKYGFIDRQGNWVIQSVFDYLGSFDDKDYCCAEVNGKYGFIDRQGNWVIKPVFDYLGSFDDKDYCSADVNGKYGFIERQGNWVIQPAFDRLGSFDDKDYCVASLNDKYGFINRQGNWIIQPIFDSIYNNYFSVLNRRINKFQVNDLKYGLITNDGKWVLEPNYWHIDFTEYPDIFEASLNNKLGFINSLGDWIIQPYYDYEITDFEGEKMIWDVNNQVWKFDFEKN